MRTLLIASAVIALVAADGAAAQVAPHGAGYPMPGAHQMPPPPPIVQHRGANRWGSKIGGHWWGGANAPGGWQAYRRPVRGYALPRYWVAPRFYINDWASYRLAPPPAGYNWARYYDDAVLIDSRGSVYDSVDGIDWDGYGEGGYAGDRGPPPPPPGRHDDGVGGAVVGAVAGGVAGNLIAGRGNRLGGTLIGAGVGAAAGYAIDKSDDRDHRRGPPPRVHGPGPGYPPPGSSYDSDYRGDYLPPPPPPPAYRGAHGYHDRGGTWISPDGLTTVTTTNGYINGPSYYAGGYGGSTTTVTVESAPQITTTTTEIYDDRVTYSGPHRVWAKKMWHKKIWRPKTKLRCACGS